MQNPLFYKNRIQRGDNQSVKFIVTLSQNLEYQKNVLKYWDQIGKNPQGKVLSSDLLEVITAIIKCIICLPDESLKQLSQQYLESMTDVDPNLPEYLSYQVFVDAITQLLFQLINQPDLSSAIYLLKTIHARIYRRQLIDVKDNTNQDIDYHILVKIHNTDRVEQSLRNDNKKSYFPIYYTEQYIYNSDQLQSADIIPSRIIKYKLAPLNEIIPIGMSCECMIFALMNNNFQECEYQHYTSSQYAFAKEIKLIGQVTETFLMILPNSQLVPDIGLQYLIEQNDDSYGFHSQYYKLNKLITRDIQWCQFPLKNQDGNKLLINIKSEFFTEEDYRIDQINKVNKKWERKIVSAKRQLLTSQLQTFDISKSSNPDKRQSKNIPFILRTFLGDLNQPKDQQQLQSALEVIQEQQTNIELPSFQSYLSKFISPKGQLPIDSKNPYEDDVIEYANQAPPQIFLIAKPRSGRSTFAKALAKQLDLEYLDLEKGIQRIYAKVAENENNPQMDEEGNPKEFLNPLEREVFDSLRFGRELTQEQLESLFNVELSQDLPKNKGYILDLPLENIFWVNSILSNKMILPKIGCRYFTHVVNLYQSDEDVLHFASKIMEKQDDLIATSQYDREEQKRPKIKYKDPNDPDEEEDQGDNPDDEDKPPIIPEKDLFYRPLDQEFLVQSLSNFQESQQKLLSLYDHLPDQNIITLQSAGLTTQQLVDRVFTQILKGQPLRPLAIKLEGGSEKDLLGLNLTDEKVYRMWSQWQQVDAVELVLKDKIIAGKAEFACEYAGRVFLFDNEDNQNKFINYPRKYLCKAPQLPKTYIVSVQGPKCSGKNTVASQLAEFYGWTLVDVEDIVRKKVQAQQERSKHLQSTFDPRVNDIHLTEIEWKEFYKGNVIKDVLPMVLNYLNIPLQRKPVGWGEPKKDDEEQPAEEDEEKKKKEAKKQQAKKKKEEVVEVVEENVKPVTPPPEDIPTKEIIPLLDAELKIPETSKPKGIVIIGYPQTQEQIDQLNLWGIKIDKFIILQDRSEEPGQILLQRNPDIIIEQELNQINALSALIKEAYQEENVKEIPIDGTKDEVWSRVRLALDPFQIRVDDEGLVRVPGDVQEGEEPIPYGDYANYCPVTLQKTNWLVPGKEEFIALVRGRVYRFYGEKEQQIFKDNVQLFVPSKITIPQPRIMFIGVRGSGLHTQLKILNRLYKLPVLDLKDNLIQNLEINKKNRQLNRYYMKGFKPKELDADGKEIPDPEITEDPADFDRKAHEIDVLNKILDCGGVIINANFFDVSEELVSTPIVDLLVEAKKLPEYVILLKIEPENFIKRNFNSKFIEDEYQMKMEELRQKRYQERVEARNKAIEEGAEELPSLEAPPGEEEDPEAPKLEEMLKEQKDKLLQQHEADMARIEELQRQFEELKINAVIISTDTNIENVTERITSQLENVMDREYRENMLEKEQCQKLNLYPDPTNFKLNKLDIYEKIYTHKQSKYGNRNAITLQNVPHCRDYPVLYRNRIYYLDNDDQREQVCQRPFKYFYKPTVPNDVQIKPTIFILGKVKSGKTEIVRLLSEKLNLVRVKVSHLLAEFVTNQTDLLAVNIKNQLKDGKEVDTQYIIQIIQKRIQLADVYNQGYILDGYPRTIDEALALSKVGIIPTVVFVCDKDDEYVIRKLNPKFGGIDHVVHQRLKANQTSLLASYYQSHFNNVRYLQVGQVSSWGMISLCTKCVQENLYSRALVARALITQEPVRISSLTLTEQQIIQKLSPLYNYCPVLIKAKKNYVASQLRSPYLLFYDDQLFYVSSEDTEQDFIKNPTHYCNNSIEKYKIPRQLTVGDKFDPFPEYKGHCPVELINNNLVKGLNNLVIIHKNQQQIFANAYNMQLFEMNPQRYKHARLPDKMQLGELQSVKNIAKKVAKRGDCTSYLELHLKNIIIRVLAQLGYQKPKYPTLSCKETVLKFIAISLKANNKNKDAFYRNKYQEKLEKFMKNCTLAQEIQEMYKISQESEIDEETLLQKVEQFDQFMAELQAMEKQKYFQQFIR
ncbi:unnamed protein product [Paramecium sonneborni]|uniref:Adenylate kinase n=1 Tax=Paramecium sonneborni TaxID=65129 RepID=A0A8S1PKE2_9CILI|nr:unnamed protein product [Paramecium sonneborni]